jgi:hypothetical protein
MKKTMLVALAIVLAFAATPAFAFSLANNYSGPVTFVYTGYSSSQDTVNGYTAEQAHQVEKLDDTEYANVLSSTEGETWGIMSIARIEDKDGKAVWLAGTNNEFLYGVFYGFYDSGYSSVGTQYGIEQVGGGVSLYLSSISELSGAYNTSLGTAGRLDWDKYQSISDLADAQLFLTADFNASPIAGDALTTMYQTADSTTSPTYALGTGFADVTGGQYASLFDSGLQLDANGQGHDFKVETTADLTSTADWDQKLVSNSFQGHTLPEPTTMLLFGTGLIGLVGVGFRKKQA